MSQTLAIELGAHEPEDVGALVIYAAEGAPPAGRGAAVWAESGLDWDRIVKASGFAGKPGQMIDLIAPPGLSAGRLVVLGSGKPEAASEPAAWTDRGGSLMARLMALRVETAAVVIEADATPEAVAELVAGLYLRHYRFETYKSAQPENGQPESLTVTLGLADPEPARAAVETRMATIEGTLLARDLLNEPPNVLGTLEFVARVRELEALGVTVEVLEEEEMDRLGMRALLAVGRGSARPCRLVVMRWRGEGAGERPIAFVGKGVVFDSGGLSIKPAASMIDMKGDMGGAAAVTGLMHALARRKARADVVGVIGLVENMLDADAMRPGDIVRAMSGTTIEIVNTDAEGRLVLADALWYTQDRFKPLFMVDLATLTGAIVVALGDEHAGLFANDEELAGRLIAAGLATNEKLWRMPLAPAYDKLIESRFADIKNSGGRPAGACTAAQFLARFVNDVPWAHLDIASTAFGAAKTETSAGWAPGFGVALLDRFVRDHYEAAP